MSTDLEQKEELKSLLTLLKLDATNLYHRITIRKEEYISEFSLKRSREHFKEIFKNRYDDIKIDDLKRLHQELILVLDEYYTKIDQLKWYLNHTQDMTSTVYDNVSANIRQLQKSYEKLSSYLKAELEIIS